MARIIGVVSGKGGVGKTTLTSNLALALSKIGKKVTIIDCNLTTPHLGFSFGFYFYSKTLNDVLRANGLVNEATYIKENVNIIPASLKTEDLIGVDIENLKNVIEYISSDFVFLDSAPGLGREALAVLRISQEILFVATPYVNAVIDVVKCNKLARQLGSTPIGIVLNMVKGTVHELRKSEIEGLTRLPVIAVLPYDEEVEKALSVGLPILSYNKFSPSSIEIMRLAGKILGEEIPEEKPSFFSSLYLKIRNKLFLRRKIPNINV